MTTTARDMVRQRMEDGDVPATAQEAFLLHWDRVHDGARGTLSESDISPVERLPTFHELEQYRHLGRAHRGRVAMIKLNGGLGTSMGLERAKSLLKVRGELTFLDLICQQVRALRGAGAGVPLLLMNSFRTEGETLAHLSDHYPELLDSEIPPSFLQHRVPKIDAATLEPATSPTDPELAWCPPGHGDLYTAMVTSGTLDQLVAAGFRFAFVSNADNLGAVIDDALLGYMVSEQRPFVMEVALRTEADRKGGHLCQLEDGRLALREAAQVPQDDEALEAFQNVERYRFFNTNNLWLDLQALSDRLAESGGILPLPTIVNRKTLDPREKSSPAVFQLETAMGAAISELDSATAVEVPRSRFSPVKTTNDLLAVSSDAYVVTDDACVQLHRDRQAPPNIHLDTRYFKMVDDFSARFASGVPSLLHCSSLRVDGDVTFAADVVVRGDVHIRADAPLVLSQGTILEGTIHHLS